MINVFEYEETDSLNIVEYDRFGGDSLVVLGGIFMGSRTILLCIKGADL